MELQKLCDGYYVVENGKCVYKSKSKKLVRNFIINNKAWNCIDKQILLDQLYLEA